MLKKADKTFLVLFLILVVIGFLSFFSASLGILARNENLFYQIIKSQLLGLGIGILVFLLATKVSLKFWQKFSFFIFFIFLILTALVFIPSLGFEHAGAKRWLSFGFISFQPVEFLKIGFLLYFSSVLAQKEKRKLTNFQYFVFIICFLASIVILFFQPDVKNFLIIFTCFLTMVFLSGISWKKIFLFLIIFAFGIIFVLFLKPHAFNRVMVFLNPEKDPLGASYQVQQSLIAVGSGQIWGRGFGQGIQKFGYLPEPHGDSVFAVFAEEFGFVGSFLFIILYFLFILRGLKIASKNQDIFARLLGVGIVIIITSHFFLNVGSSIGIFPLTGVPLSFVSHGGSALIANFFMTGLIISISKNQKI